MGRSVFALEIEKVFFAHAKKSYFIASNGFFLSILILLPMPNYIRYSVITAAIKLRSLVLSKHGELHHSAA